MNPSYADMLRKTVNWVLLPAGIVALLWAVVFLFLRKADLPQSAPVTYGYHYRFTPAALLLPSNAPASKEEKIESATRISDIKLKGIYIEGASGFAVIDEGGKAIFVNKGERYRGYRLKALYDDRVIFEKGGKNFEVILKESKTKTAHGARSPYTSSAAAPTVSVGGSVEVSREELNDYVRHPNKIWRNIRIQEIRRHGQIEGFRVNYVRKHSVFDRFGLKSGDIITAIDGNEIHSLGEVMRYYNEATSLEALTLTVKRGNELIDIDFNVN